MWPEQKCSGHISFPNCFAVRAVTLCAHRAIGALHENARAMSSRADTRTRSRTRHAHRVASYCVMWISLSRTINVHGQTNE